MMQFVGEVVVVQLVVLEAVVLLQWRICLEEEEEVFHCFVEAEVGGLLFWVVEEELYYLVVVVEVR
jgi:hypothetical protein